jgi:shikimate dehydrogenase
MIADYSYELKEIGRDALDVFLKEKDFKAINVTIPYKEAVIPYIDFISDEARAIGAVNTIVNKDGKLYGYNTDFFGMSALINKTKLDLKGKKVAILGTGGTSKTAYAVSKSLGASTILKVSRSEKNDAITYDELLRDHTDIDVLINTTPIGMYPDNLSSATDLSNFKKLEGGYECSFTFDLADINTGEGEVYFNAYRLDTDGGKDFQHLYALNPTVYHWFHMPDKFLWLGDYV